MLGNLKVFASGLLKSSHRESAVYIPHVWLLSNILFLITNDAAISHKHKKDKHSLLSVMSWSSMPEEAETPSHP